jgi:hypothetical protein
MTLCNAVCFMSKPEILYVELNTFVSGWWIDSQNFGLNLV